MAALPTVRRLLQRLLITECRVKHHRHNGGHRVADSDRDRPGLFADSTPANVDTDWCD